ncbi:MAG: histidine phosphatase family protein [Sulfurospirillaceae bacterium]|nr:histidine phosphatase family protein [Sulfurospirillaceae bacterium]MDD3463658.1 histidine phosphatase family protein [Sulfurospirillaceae bacterium]
MKKIYLIRHAKSSWKDDEKRDFDRDLNKRGKNDANMMGKRLKIFNVKPDILYSSPAKRAKETAFLIAKEVGYDTKKITYLDNLYESSCETYMEIIKKIDNENNAVFIIGHNPFITEIGELLSGAILTNIPTCAIVCLEFEVTHFKDICEESGKVLFFDYPKKHNNEKK